MKTEKSDVEKYIARRKARDPKFAKDFEEGWEVFRLGAMLVAFRERAGISQAELARRVGMSALQYDFRNSCQTCRSLG